MKLPSLKIAIPFIFILWCIAGFVVYKSPVMLAYPAMWAGVALLFVGLHFMLRAPAAPKSSTVDDESTELPTSTDSSTSYSAEKEMSASA